MFAGDNHALVPSQGFEKIVRHALFDGTPATMQVTDDRGLHAFQVSDTIATPAREALAVCLGCVTSVTATLTAIAAVVHFGQAVAVSGWMLAGLWGAAIVAPWIAVDGFTNLWRKRLRLKFTVLLTDEEVRVQQKCGRWIAFTRKLDHRFSMVEHPRALREREENEFLIRRGQREGRVVRARKLYEHSLVISYDVLGQRHPILNVFGREDATAILFRLNAIDRVLEEQARIGRALGERFDLEERELVGRLPDHAEHDLISTELQ